ncbi:MAG: CAP domain-containing protein [Streptosporangiaceae bacterium]
MDFHDPWASGDGHERSGRHAETGVDMSAGAPARHRAPRHGAHPPLPEPPPPGASYPYDPPPGTPPSYGRARFLLCGLLVLPLLAGAGVYLTRGSVPAPASATGQLAVAPPASLLCDPSAAGSTGSCAAQPFHAAVASVPASLSPRASAVRTRHSHATPSPSASASASARVTAPSPTGPAPTASATSPAGTSSGSAAAQVLALINQARSAAGLAPLTITAGLNSSASAHNSRMAGGCGLSHQCSGEPDLGARETAAGVHWTAAGENIGEGGPVANTTAAIAQMAVGLTQAMLNEKPPDDGHRRNILSSSFTHIGITVFRDSSGTVWLTQDFSN